MILFTKTCVRVSSSHLFWTSSSLDIPAGVTQEEGYTGFLIHLPSAVRASIFLARRIQPFLSLADREVEFCILRPSFMGIGFGSGILLDLVLFADRIVAEPKSNRSILWDMEVCNDLNGVVCAFF